MKGGAFQLPRYILAFIGADRKMILSTLCVISKDHCILVVIRVCLKAKNTEIYIHFIQPYHASSSAAQVRNNNDQSGLRILLSYRN